VLAVLNLDPGKPELAIAGERNLSGRAAIVAVLEDWQVICSAVVAAGSMIMLGIMLYRDWPQ
jgi:hypothetical protein